MKLSEAIRLGSLLRPQAFGAFMDDEGGSCAMGAAMEAAGIRLRRGANKEILVEMEATETYAEWKRAKVYGKPYECPVCKEGVPFADRQGQLRRNITSIIIHLNNDHEWTRGEIADWVATFETASTPVETRELVGAAP